ncbi:uncharacterized protein LOC115753196 [Rhodamnia argentea]|uniref:Uncharacterized protein LOC115753196 n=1 Tax=Rhodamnia argentea TaxID=178133 RepID=A0A8B8QKK6_9MYRT|nr:uncharacterized protein LOC115753196 [Rhodamnia argentea]
MRFLFCKLHCPFICFCKPAPHIYTPGPLKLESAPHVPPSTVVSVPDASHQLSAQTNEVKHDERRQQHQQGEVGNCVKSSLKKATLETKESRKKQVQWMDFMGKELSEVREFESSEIHDNYKDAETNRGCVCVIL